MDQNNSRNPTLNDCLKLAAELIAEAEMAEYQNALATAPELSPEEWAALDRRICAALRQYAESCARPPER